jgi:hypothetical protein
VIHRVIDGDRLLLNCSNKTAGIQTETLHDEEAFVSCRFVHNAEASTQTSTPPASFLSPDLLTDVN